MGVLSKKIFMLVMIVMTVIFSFMSICIEASNVQARASHILVDTEKEIDDLYKEIVASDDVTKKFAEVAKAKSKCPSGRQGGDLGTFGRGAMVPEFDKVVFEESVGEVHKVKTQFGWHLLITTERTGDEKDDL